MSNLEENDIKTMISETLSQSSTPKEDEETLKLLENKSSKQKLIWTVQIEELLRRWCDISACYKWLHDESFRIYKNSNYWYSIPIILLSTIAGGLNLSLTGYVPAEYLSFSQAGIGALNIFTGVLTTLQNFFKYAQLSESHANASQGWSKIQRNIEVELKLEKEFRTDADRFLRDCRRDYDRLIEQSPPIPKDIIKKFKSTFKNENNLIRPDIVDKITHTDVYRAPIPEIKINIPVEKEEIKVINVNELKNILVEDELNHPHHPHHYNKNNNHQNNNHQNINHRKSFIQPPTKNNNYIIENDFPVKEREYSKSVIDDMPVNRPKIKDLIKKFTDADDIFEKKKKQLFDITIVQNNNEEEKKIENVNNNTKQNEENNEQYTKNEEQKVENINNNEQKVENDNEEEKKELLNESKVSLEDINRRYSYNFVPGVFSLTSSLYNLNKKK